MTSSAFLRAPENVARSSGDREQQLCAPESRRLFGRALFGQRGTPVKLPSAAEFSKVVAAGGASAALNRKRICPLAPDIAPVPPVKPANTPINRAAKATLAWNITVCILNSLRAPLLTAFVSADQSLMGKLSPWFSFGETRALHNRKRQAPPGGCISTRSHQTGHRMRSYYNGQTY